MMNYRQKTLLGLLSAFGGHLPDTDFQKYLFLYTREFQQEPSFEFVPYRFGSFSFQSYADKRRLVDMGALADAEDWQMQEGFATTGLFEEATYGRCYAKYSHLHGTKLRVLSASLPTLQIGALYQCWGPHRAHSARYCQRAGPTTD